MNKNLLILGAGSHGQVVKETAAEMGEYDRIDFLDDIRSDISIGPLYDYQKIDNYRYAFAAFGHNYQRCCWIEKLQKHGFVVPVLKHPTAYISSSATILEGTIIEAMAVINTNVTIEKGCIIGLGAVIDHNATIKNGSRIESGAIVKYFREVESYSKIDSGNVFDRQLSYF